MSQESDRITKNAADVKRESEELIAAFVKAQTDVVAANEATAAAIAAGASDKEIADAAKAAQPQLEQAVTDMDTHTPAGTPVIIASRGARRR